MSDIWRIFAHAVGLMILTAFLFANSDRMPISDTLPNPELQPMIATAVCLLLWAGMRLFTL